MTVQHKPGTLGEAIARAAAPLGGYSNAGRSLGLRACALSHYANDSKPDRLPIDIALRLDRACREAGGGAPIMDYYVSEMDRTPCPHESPFTHLASFSEAGANVQMSFARALADGRIDAKEREELIATLAKAKAQITRTLTDLKSEREDS